MLLQVTFSEMVVDKLHRSGGFSCQFLPLFSQRLQKLFRRIIFDGWCGKISNWLRNYRLFVEEIDVVKSNKTNPVGATCGGEVCKALAGEGARTGGCGPLLHSINQAILPPTISAYKNDNEEDDNKDNGIDNRDKCWKQRQVYQSGNTTTSA